MFEVITFLSFLVLLLQPSKGFLLKGPCERHHPARRGVSSLSPLYVLWDPKNNLDQINGLIEFPTPSQKMELKKEASKRQARNVLPSLSIPVDETLGNFSDETLAQAWDMLKSNELIQIRGIAREDKKMVFTVATRLCFELELRQEDAITLPVALLSTKGHSSIIYSPTLDLDDPKKFLLRTSVGAKNTWTERVKAPRDNRGQIIRNASGDD